MEMRSVAQQRCALKIYRSLDAGYVTGSSSTFCAIQRGILIDLAGGADVKPKAHARFHLLPCLVRDVCRGLSRDGASPRGPSFHVEGDMKLPPPSYCSPP